MIVETTIAYRVLTEAFWLNRGKFSLFLMKTSSVLVHLILHV